MNTCPSHRGHALALALVLATCATTPAQTTAAKQEDGPYAETWDSLATHPVPAWFQDAKFGIYAHWGVYSVPAYGNEWYPRNMYTRGSDTWRHHVATWGDPSKFGYKDFVPLFTAERFDADAWADLFVRAGARFAGPVAEHHDGFSMWASDVNRWNAGAMGPRRDVAGELVAAVRARGLKVITSFHHSFHIQGYYPVEPGFDTADPAYADLYGKLDEATAHRRWLAKISEVVERYHPDQLWFDFGLAHIPAGLQRRMVALYYNAAAGWGGDVVLTRKAGNLPEGVGVLDIERGKMERSAPQVWQTDDSVAVNSWCWVEGLQLKPAEELVHELIDIVAKNGVLLLNVAPKADGTIPDDQRELLLAIGRWLERNGEAIYATRPWLVHGEGPHLVDAGRGFDRQAVRFGAQDVRYTRKGDTLYAICLGRPAGELTLHAVHVEDAGANARVELLGSQARIPWGRDPHGQLVLALPDLAQDPGQHAWAFALRGFRLDLSDEARFDLPGASKLVAEHAVLDGDQLRTETRDGRTDIGFWDDGGESVHWLVRVRAPGPYLLRAEVAAAAGPTRLAVELDGQRLEADVPAAKGWDQAAFVDLGRIEVSSAGVHHLVLRAADPASWRAVNVWQLQLAPAR